MSEKTKIQWCDSTVNFWSGCTKVSPGCANCYAEARDSRHMIEPVSHWGLGAPRLGHKGAVKMALAINRKPWVCDVCGSGYSAEFGNRRMICATAGCGGTVHNRRVFANSQSDWLDHEVPVEWLAAMLDTIRQCPNVEWILCTKRPELWMSRMGDAYAAASGHAMCEWMERWRDGDAPPNITLLTSVENQEQADKRIPALLRIPAARRGLSLEPLLGPVDLKLLSPRLVEPLGFMGHGLDWLIIGGESGPKARPCNVAWIRSIVHQGQAAGVPVFVKQLGSWLVNQSRIEYAMNGDQPILHPKGGDPAEWPADLRVQQFPY